MFHNDYSPSQYDDDSEYDSEDKDDLYKRQHLSADKMDKLRNILKTKVIGEPLIKLSDLERILHLAGQNMTKNTIEKIKKQLEDTYHIDEYFLDEIEYIIAPYWENLTDDEIRKILIESFEIFDDENQGFIDRNYLIKCLTTLGDMPLNKNDFKIMFSIVKRSKSLSNQFDYKQFVNKLCGLDNKNERKIKRKIKRKTKNK